MCTRNVIDPRSSRGNVFDDDSLELHADLTANDVDNWDSLTHINLIVAIEKEFRIRFTTSEVSGLKNVGELEALVWNERFSSSGQQNGNGRCAHFSQNTCSTTLRKAATWGSGSLHGDRKPPGEHTAEPARYRRQILVSSCRSLDPCHGIVIRQFPNLRLHRDPGAVK